MLRTTCYRQQQRLSCAKLKYIILHVSASINITHDNGSHIQIQIFSKDAQYVRFSFKLIFYITERPLALKCVLVCPESEFLSHPLLSLSLLLFD